MTKLTLFGFLFKVVVCCAFSAQTLPEYKQSYMNWISTTDPVEFRVLQTQFMLRSMNKSVDPCQNFFHYTCGKWASSVPKEYQSSDVIGIVEAFQFDLIKQLLNSSVSWSDNRAEIKAKQTYSSCVNESTYNSESLSEIVRSFGVFPAFYSRWTDLGTDWITIAAHAAVYNITTFFRTDRHNDHVVIGSGVMPPYWRNVARSSVEYHRYMKKSLEILNLNPSYISDMAERLYEFEKRLELLPMGINPLASDPRLKRRQFRMHEEQRSRLTRVMNRARKQTHFVTFSNGGLPIDVQKYLLMYYGKTFSDVFLVSIEYMEKLSDLLLNTDSRTLADFFFWRIVSTHTWSLQLTDEERSEACVSYVIKNLKSAVISLLSKKFINQRTRDYVTDIVRRLKEEMIERVNRNPLFSRRIRENQLNIIDKVDVKLFHPDYILSDFYMKREYEDLHISPYDFMRNQQELGYFVVDNAIRMKVTRKDPNVGWHDPLEVNAAFLSRGKGVLNINMALLFPPIFHSYSSSFNNYATVAYVIAHEMIHAFENILTSELLSFRSSLERLKCVIDRYNAYRFHGIDKNVDGVTTLLENLSDIDGLRIAFGAYQKLMRDNTSLAQLEMKGFEALNLTANQAFFVSYAQFFCDRYQADFVSDLIEIDRHAPNRVRVIIPLANLDEFSEEFRCPAGSPMNATNKCRYFT